MNSARIEIHGNLNDFLEPGVRPSLHEVPLTHHSQLKDTVESLGVPHPEIDCALVNGRPAAFTRRLKPGDTVAIFPEGESPSESLVRTAPHPTRFVVDANLGRLKTLLRTLGFDCFYENNLSDEHAAHASRTENRTLLTKDVGVLMRAKIVHGYWVRAGYPDPQLGEVIRRFDLRPKINPLSRCIDCNEEIVPVAKKDILDRLEPLTKKYYDKFFQCPKCGKIYWEGSHVERMRDWMSRL